MIPFRSIGGTLSQVTVIVVDELTMTATLSGGLAGTARMRQESVPHTSIHDNIQLTVFICHNNILFTVRPISNTGEGSDRNGVVHKLF